MVAAAATLALVGCGRGEPAGPSGPSAAPGRAIDAGWSIDAGLAIDAGRSIDASESRTVRIPDETSALIVVTTADWDATAATIARWRRTADGWVADGPSWPAVVGVSGLAWGRGVHGDGPPDGAAGPVKREGDGRGPAGMFALGGAYGYAAAPPAGTRLPYRAVTKTWRCVDDAASTRYGQVFDAKDVAVDWRSAEDLRRPDALYTWVIDVRHNPTATPGAGSCIFLHVWRGPDDATAGCTAMAAPRLAALLADLDPATAPLLVQLPAPVYAAVAGAWGLPPP